jgi:hypothetical protein
VAAWLTARPGRLPWLLYLLVVWTLNGSNIIWGWAIDHPLLGALLSLAAVGVAVALAWQYQWKPKYRAESAQADSG